MATPITWRNVDTPRMDDAARLLVGAQNSLNTGFTNINDVLKAREANDTANWNQQKINNTNDFMAQGNAPVTPEEFQAQRAALQGFIQSKGAQIDSVAAQNFMNNQMGTLQNRATAGITYDTAQRNEQNRVPLDQAMAAATQGKGSELEALRAANPNMPVAPLYAALQQRQQQVVAANTAAAAEARAAQDQERQNLLAPLQRDALLASTEHSRAATNELSGTRAAELDKAETKRAREERLALRTKVAEGGVLNLGAANSKEGYKTINDHLSSKLVNPDDAVDIQKELGPLLSTPILGESGKAIPIPTSYVLDAIRGMGSRGYTGRWVNQVSDQVRERVLRDQDKIMQDHNDLLKLDFTDATRPVANESSLTPQDNAPTSAITKAAEVAKTKGASVPENVAAARKSLLEAGSIPLPFAKDSKASWEDTLAKKVKGR